jgi:hypothetical protein
MAKARQTLGSHPLYHIWRGMMHRCENPRATGFKNYGGRGIKVCDRWRNSLELFAADMGPRPSDKHSLDRLDNGGHYEPGNVRWVTQQEQMSNCRHCRYLTANGETKTLSAWAREIGTHRATVQSLLKEGKSIEEIIAKFKDNTPGSYPQSRRPNPLQVGRFIQEYVAPCVS